MQETVTRKKNVLKNVANSQNLSENANWFPKSCKKMFRKGQIVYRNAREVLTSMFENVREILESCCEMLKFGLFLGKLPYFQCFHTHRVKKCSTKLKSCPKVFGNFLNRAAKCWRKIPCVYRTARKKLDACCKMLPLKPRKM